jgi:hypothetical protein
MSKIARPVTRCKKIDCLVSIDTSLMHDCLDSRTILLVYVCFTFLLFSCLSFVGMIVWSIALVS